MREYQDLIIEYKRILNILAEFKKEPVPPNRQSIQNVAITALEEELLKLSREISYTARIRGVNPQ
jgi:hypothetical protein